MDSTAFDRFRTPPIVIGVAGGTGSGKTTVHGIRSAAPTRSQAQLAQSLRFSQAVNGWKLLSQLQKQAWKTRALLTGYNGYQLYLSEYQTQNIQPPNNPIIP